MRHFTEFWSTTGWKMAYAIIVVTAIAMLIVMFSQEVHHIMDAVISITIFAAIAVGGWWLMTKRQEYSCL